MEWMNKKQVEELNEHLVYLSSLPYLESFTDVELAERALTNFFYARWIWVDEDDEIVQYKTLDGMVNFNFNGKGNIEFYTL